MINRVIFVGRLTRDPEVRSTPNGTKVTKFGVATNRSWKNKDGEWCEKTTFSDWSVWNGVGENFARSAAKGDLVYLEGEYGLNEWEDNEGNKRSRPEFTGFTVRVLSKAGAGKPVSEESKEDAPAEPKKRGRKPKDTPKVEPENDTESDDVEVDDQDVPF